MDVAVQAASKRAADAAAARAGYVRWFICALLFFAATINYVDRQVIGILKTPLSSQFGWSELDYADIVFAFQFAYAIGFVFAGRFMDRFRHSHRLCRRNRAVERGGRGHAWAPAFGGVASGALAMVGLGYSTSVGGFMFMRFLLGLGESGNFPAAIKTVAEWFPKLERALATGIFNSGTNVGALVTPLVVPSLTVAYGWAWAFLATGLLGFLWLAMWLAFYARPDAHPRLGAAERSLIESDPPEPASAVSWRRLVPYRQTWAFALGKFLTDPIWWRNF